MINGYSVIKSYNMFPQNTTATEAKESWCYVPCGVDCELSEWGAWDASACSCGDANTASHMRRTRYESTTSDKYK